MQIKDKNLVFNIKELIQMKWQEVRELYLNQFVKFEIVEYHEDEKIKYVDEVAVIKAIKDGREAMKEITKCKNVN
jgi:translation initiation factor 2 beta subunit (eIF-2beta)/eIF-5